MPTESALWRGQRGPDAEETAPGTPAAHAVREKGPAYNLYEELFELAPDAYLFTNPAGRILRANRAACALLNCARPRLLYAPLSAFMRSTDIRHLLRDLPPPPSDLPYLPEREIQIRPLRREPIPVGVTLGIARDSAGRRHGLRWLLRDISERKRVEERLQASVREKELLLREVYHRVKNNLQVICSLLSLQEAPLADPSAAAVLRTARDRVRSMALVHERLYRSADVSRVDFADYLRQLARELRHSFGIASEDIRFVFSLANANLGIDVAIPCSMIVHELVTNALRHAFPSGRGTIDIELTVDGPRRARLVVTDDGVGLAAEGDGSRGGLGLPLVRLMVEQIGGELHVRRSPGAQFRVVFPLSDPTGENA